MFLITIIKDNGKDGMTFPSDCEDNIDAATEQFTDFCNSHPMVVLGGKIAKIRRVVETEEVGEIVLPEVDIQKLLKDALAMLKS